MLSINTNLSSLIAQNSMKTSTDKLNQAIERMTTGFKINHAKDNAANYSISTDMTTKIGAYQVAEDNCAQGLDMVATASDTISLLQDKTTRLHALSTQARNGTYGAQSLNAINAEANALMTEISRLYNSAQFNGTNLFNQKEMEIADHLPKAKAEYNGFIENPFTYTAAEVAAMTKLESVDENTTISSGKYSIYTLDELVQLQEMTNNRKITGGEFVLGADIDLASIDNWTPIGNHTNNSFKGTFDGNGHVIRNLKIDRPTANGVGLFGEGTNATIKNVALEHVNVKGGMSTGSLVGGSNTPVHNCYVTDAVIKGSSHTGGLCGGGTFFNNCYATNVKVSGDTYVGGLSGRGNVNECFAMADVLGNKKVGGLSGEFYQTSKNSYAVSNVEGSSYVGGLFGCGAVSYNVSIQNCASYSKVNGTDSATTGSFIGGVQNTSNNTTFGTLNITNCEALPQEMNMIGGVYKTDDTDSLQNDMTAMLAGISNVAVKNVITTLQVGINSDDNSRLSFATNFDFGLSIDSGIESDSALNSINDFLALLESKQTELGAVQNRLESALDEISIKYENLVSSRSTLRDADIAKVSSTYIQQQILQQASATLMATANQSPAIALQLI